VSKLKTNEELFAYSKTLSVIPAEDLAELLGASKIKVPLYIHRFVLRETLYPKVFANALYQTYTDELKYRLRGYHDYSIYLLEKLITDYNLDFDAAKYKEIFFDILFLNADLYGIKEHFFNELDKLKYKYAVDFETINYPTFLACFAKLFYEPSGYLDGVKLTILKDVMIHSSTLGDLRGLGEKFGVKVPRRINKNQLVDILTRRFRLSQGEIDLLNAKSVLELEIYAKEKGFTISIDLKKSDMVEYIVFSLNMYHLEVEKDAHNYDVPLAVDLDSVKIEEIQFVSNDQDIPVIASEPVKASENKPEPLPEEKKPEPVVQTLPAEEEVTIAPIPENPAEVVPEKKPEPVVEKKKERLAEKIEKPAELTVLPEKTEPQREPMIEPEPTLKPVLAESGKNFSEEERALLDEKINLIIKKYQKKRRQRAFWTVFWIVGGLAVLCFGAYCVFYYSYVPGQHDLPFGIPWFW
jgi:hypothetical protein